MAAICRDLPGMEIRGNTRVFGILGHPVAHSLSPLLHNMAFENTGYPGVYIPLDVKETGPFLKKTLQNLNLGGLSVTIPHKIWAFRMADQSDALSKICGASNTLLFKEKGGKMQIEARNSDGPGAIQALRQVTSIRGKSVLICGYGGSARAIAAQLLISEKPSEIWITGRNPTRIKSFIRDLKKQFPRASIQSLDSGAAGLPGKAGKARTDVSASSKNRAGGVSRTGSSVSSRKTARKKDGPGGKSSERNLNIRSPDILIQTTPLGMTNQSASNRGSKKPEARPTGRSAKASDEDLPLNPALIQPSMTVFDIVYSPMNTPLLTLAKKRKCKIVYGYSMLLYQAVFQFRWFTGKEPPIQRWEKLLRNDLKRKNKS